MGVYKYNKTWYYKFVIRGKQYHRAIPEAVNERQAIEAETFAKSEIFKNKFNLVDNIGEMMFSDLIDVYIEYTKSNNLSWKCNTSKAERFRTFFRNKRLNEITPIMVENYRIQRKKEFKDKKQTKKISNATINRDIEILRKIFNIAIDNDWCDKNPASSKKVKKFREDNHIIRSLSVEEEQALLEACTCKFKYLKNIIITALNTGMRKNEILGLTWDCVNFQENFIALLKTKSGKSRNIPINVKLREILQEQKELSTGNYVFENPETHTRYSDLKRSFINVCKKANVKNFRFHDLRHTAATRMASSNINLIVVKDILGHADIKTTMRYAHPVDEIKLQAVNALANYH